MMKLAASLLLLAMVVSGQEHHSVQKRQTTVSFEGTYEDFRELAIRITLAFTVAGILVVVVAPLFGYKIDLIVTQLMEVTRPAQELAMELDMEAMQVLLPQAMLQERQGNWPQDGPVSSAASTLWTLPSTTWTLRMRPAA